MNKTSKTVVFFGSGPVAASCLELLTKHQDIEAVVTKPKPAHHRGTTPVLEVAQRLNLRVVTVTDKNDLGQQLKGRPFKSDLGVLIDFGIIVDQAIIDYFPLGIINSHFSVLPDLRGADPISFTILSGQTSTGVSLMQLVAALDEGPLLSFAELELDGTETTPSLTEQLIQLSDALLQAGLPLYQSGQAQLAPQSVTGRAPSYSHKLRKADGLLDFKKPAVQLEREVRAYAGWPKSRTTIAGKDVVITEAHVVESKLTTGRFANVDKQLLVGTSQGTLAIDKLKPAGKAEMSAAAFLAGHKL